MGRAEPGLVAAVEARGPALVDIRPRLQFPVEPDLMHIYRH